MTRFNSNDKISPEEIARREIDYKVALNVFGRDMKFKDSQGNTHIPTEEDFLPKFSHNPSAMMELIERLASLLDGGLIQMTGPFPDGWEVRLIKGDKATEPAKEKTLMEAVCSIALRCCEISNVTKA